MLPSDSAYYQVETPDNIIIKNNRTSKQEKYLLINQCRQPVNIKYIICDLQQL
jgi:hypothetical protein